MKSTYSAVVGALFTASSAWAKIPTFVMLPLDTINSNLAVNDPSKLSNYFSQLKSAGTEGVMADCWWGLVEQKEKEYNFSPYEQLSQMAADAGLKIQYVLSFHQCGGNVGDDCDYPLPDWAVKSSNDIWYQDQHGNKDYEYISLFADSAAVLGSAKRTPIQAYTDFISAFKTSLCKYKFYMPSILIAGNVSFVCSFLYGFHYC